MAHITHGAVTYERRVKTGDFEHKVASVTAHYALLDGEGPDVADQLIATASALAVGHVHQILKGTPAGVGNPPAARDGAPTNAGVAAAVPAPVEHVVASDPEPVPVVVEVIEPVTNLKAAKRAAAKRSLTIDADPVPTPEVLDDFTADVPIPTEGELGQALSRVANKIKDKTRIHALIGEFVQTGQSYTMIPPVRRAEFLAKLEALLS